MQNNLQDKYLFKDLSYKIIGVAYDVYNELGFGYQEKHYQRAMANFFQVQKLSFKEQVQYNIKIEEKVIGKYYFDFLVDDKIIVEIKKGNYFVRTNISQVKSYLEISKLQLAILINFTSSGVKFMRILNIK